MGRTNIYLVSDEEPVFMDNVVLVAESDETQVLDPTKMHFHWEHEYKNPKVVKVLWMFDANRGHDTFRRRFIGGGLRII